MWQVLHIWCLLSSNTSGKELAGSLQLRQQLLEAPGQLWAVLGNSEQILAALNSSWTALGTSWQLYGSSSLLWFALDSTRLVAVTYTESNPVEERKKCSKASRRNLPVLPLKARYRLWFLWTEFKLKLALGEMDLEGLWKHALQPLLLSVMCLLWCLLSFLLRWSLLCYTTCPLCFGFGTCSVYFIVTFVCSILFYIFLLFLPFLL